MGSLVKFVRERVLMGNSIDYLKETYKTNSVFKAIWAGGWRVFIDGTLAEALLVQTPKGPVTHVGTDENGNRYYERVTDQYGRDRWVVYGNLKGFPFTFDGPNGQEASTVPPEWHGWLHHIRNETPVTSPELFKRPVYAAKHRPNPTGFNQLAYLPKGSWKNPERRNWQKYEAWKPPTSAPPQA